MAPLRALVAGFRRLLRKDRSERDLDDEVRHFLEMATDERIRAGMSRDAAVRGARLELGGVEQVKEHVRGGGWESWIESFWQDVRYGIRGLRRNPAFTGVALLTITLGIGANTAVFSVVNGVILRPLPYRDPGALVMLWTDDVRRGIHEAPTGIPTIDDWRADSAHLDDLAVYRGNAATTAIAGGDPERVHTVFAAPNLFPLLGVAPSAGRLFAPDDNMPGANVALLTDAFARRHFGSHAGAIGRTITIDGDMTAWKHDPRTVRVVGVLPAGFFFPSKDAEIFEPIRAYWRYDEEARDRDFYSVWNVVARLRSGVTVDQATTSLNQIGRRLAAQFPTSASKDFPGFAVSVVPALDAVAGRSLQSVLWMLLAVVGLVLLIACVNVANLLLARGASRDREFAVRMALGAGRMRILRQLLAENAVLALCGGALGLGAAWLALPALVALAPPAIPRLDELVIDGRVLAFTLALSVLAAAVFGFAPAWRVAVAAPNVGIKGTPGRAHRVLHVSGVLVAAECALAVVLVAGAGLLLRSFQQVESVDPGFTPAGLLVVRMSPPQQPPPGLRGVDVFRFKVTRTEELLARVAAIRGVTSAGLTGGLMMNGGPDETVTFDGEAYNEGGTRNQLLFSNGATPGFFEAIGARLLQGRFLNGDDLRFAPTLLYTSEDIHYTGRAQAVVVNESFVRAFLPGRAPLGVRFYEGHPGKPFWYEVVGVIANVHSEGLETEPAPQFYGANIGGAGDLAVRASGDPLALVSAVRQAIRDAAPGTVVGRISTGDDALATFTAQRRFQTVLLVLFAGLALSLASIGIFGVMRYAVQQRTREVGVRMALGASRLTIAGLVIRQGLTVAAIGVGVGVAGAFSLTGLLSHWLVGVTPTDPMTFAAAVALLLGAALLACWLPARRAAAVDPIRALRSE